MIVAVSSRCTPATAASAVAGSSSRPAAVSVSMAPSSKTHTCVTPCPPSSERASSTTAARAVVSAKTPVVPESERIHCAWAGEELS